MQPDLADTWLEKMRASGYRTSARCEAIVEVIISSQRALDPVEIFDEARKRVPGLGLVTVYRTIQKLEELHLVQRLHQEQGCNRVLPATQGHQHYLVCTTCGEVRFVSGDNLDALFGQIAEQTGYRVSEHWLQLAGTCPRCQGQKS